MLIRRQVARLMVVICSLAMGLSMVSCSDDDDDDDANFTLNGAGSGSGLVASTPSAATLSVYQFAVSTSTDCSDPTVVIDNGDTPQDFDMLSSPKIGTGEIPDGTYPCVIMVMAPTLSVTPSSTDGNCTAGTSFTQNVCGGNGSDGYTQDLDGTAGTCGTSTDKAYLYLSTASLLTNAYQSGDDCDRDEDGSDRICNSWEPPTADDYARGVPLGSALVVDGDEVGVFTLSNLSVTDEDDGCGMDRPDFTFAEST